MKRMSWTVLAMLLALAAPLRAQDEAEAAWAAGDHDRAERLYSARLAADSSDVAALRRLALLRAWGGRYAESLALSERLVRLAPDSAVYRLERARVLAWSGDHARAVDEVDRVLAADPTHREALEARAQFTSWAGRYEESLRAYSQLIAGTPGDPALRMAEARVLGWARRYRESTAAYDSLLARNPEDRDALLGKAQTLSWAGRQREAEAVYGRLLALDPAHLEARRGMARAAAWSGRLPLAERRWRALTRDTAAAPAYVGLSAVLRWQGRPAAALEAARQAAALAPTDPEVREELRWAALGLRPRAGSSATLETDSDDNSVGSISGSGSVYAAPRLQLRADALTRLAEQESADLSSQATTVMLGASALLEPGWLLSAGAGATRLMGEAHRDLAAVRASVSTPARNPVAGTLAFARYAFDATALLIRNEVTVQEVSATGRWAAGQWTVAGGAGTAGFHAASSGQRNRRVTAALAAMRRVTRPLAVGIGTRAFGFRDDLGDGYFDPDLYWLAEAVARYGREWRKWAVHAEGAPGWQQVGWEGDRSGSLRGAATVAYLIGPGRQVAVSASFANSGLQALSPGAGADYRYRSVTVSGSWTF